MAQRNIQNYRRVTQSIPDLTSMQAIGAAANMAENIIRQGEEAKMTEALSQASLDLSAMQNEYQIANQTNPMKGVGEYRKGRDELFNTYGETISPFYRRQWQENVTKLKTQDDTKQQAWALKQTHVNTVNSINNTIKNDLSQAMADGQAYGLDDTMELDGVLNFQASRSRLQNMGYGIIGEQVTNNMLNTYNEDYIKSYVSGVASSSPMKALQLLDNDAVKNSFSNPEQYIDMKNAVETKLLNFDKINSQRLFINEMKDNAALIMTAGQSDTPMSYAEIMQSTSGKSEQLRDFVLKANGYKEPSKTKLTDAEKMAENIAIRDQVNKFIADQDFSEEATTSLQNNLMTALNNKSITRSEANNILQGYVAPYIAFQEENLSKHKTGYWFAQDFGYNQIEDFAEEISIKGDELSGEQLFYNDKQKMILYTGYDNGLRREMASRNKTMEDINSLDDDERENVYRGAFARAKKYYLSKEYPNAVARDGTIPDRIISSNGKEINLGLNSSKPTVSVSTPKQQDIQSFGDAKSARDYIIENNLPVGTLVRINGKLYPWEGE